MKQAAKTYFKASINILTAIVAILICIFVLPKVIIFFMPFIIGWIIALIASPLVRFFEEKFKIKRKAVSAFVIIAVLAAVVLLVYGVGAKLLRETIGFIDELPVLWQQIEREFNQIGANLEGIYKRLPRDLQGKLMSFGTGLGGYFSDVVSNINLGTSTVTWVGNFAKHLPDVFMAVIMSLLSSYFFVADKSYLSEFAKKYVPHSIFYRYDMVRRSFRNAVGGYFKAQFKIMLVMVAIMYVTLKLSGVNYSFLISLGIGILDLLPIFGTGAVLWPWALYKFLLGDYFMAAVLMILYGACQVIKQLLQPKVVGDSIGINSFMTLFLLFIGYRIGGLLGILIAIPLGLVLINLFKAGTFNTLINDTKYLIKMITDFQKENKV